MVSLSSRDTIVIQTSKATPRLQQSYGESKGNKRPREWLKPQEAVHNGFMEKVTVEETLKDKKHTLPYIPRKEMGFNTGISEGSEWSREGPAVAGDSREFGFLLPSFIGADVMAQQRVSYQITSLATTEPRKKVCLACSRTLLATSRTGVLAGLLNPTCSHP